MEKQLATAKKQLEDETVARVDLENRLQSLKEELAFKDQVHEQVRSSFDAQLCIASKSQKTMFRMKIFDKIQCHRTLRRVPLLLTRGFLSAVSF